MRLTKREREAFKFLRELAEAYLNNKVDAIVTNEKDFTKLKEVGIHVERVSHKKVKKLKVGKSEPLKREITDAVWYIRGKKTKEFLPFQVAEFKEPEVDND